MSENYNTCFPQAEGIPLQTISVTSPGLLTVQGGRQREDVCCKLIATITNPYIKVSLQMANIKWITKKCSCSHQIIFKGHFKEDSSVIVAQQLFHGQPFCNSSMSTNNMHHHNTQSILENIVMMIIQRPKFLFIDRWVNCCQTEPGDTLMIYFLYQ